MPTVPPSSRRRRSCQLSVGPARGVVITSCSSLDLPAYFPPSYLHRVPSASLPPIGDGYPAGHGAGCHPPARVPSLRRCGGTSTGHRHEWRVSAGRQPVVRAVSWACTSGRNAAAALLSLRPRGQGASTTRELCGPGAADSCHYKSACPPHHHPSPAGSISTTSSQGEPAQQMHRRGAGLRLGAGWPAVPPPPTMLSSPPTHTARPPLPPRLQGHTVGGPWRLPLRR